MNPYNGRFESKVEQGMYGLRDPVNIIADKDSLFRVLNTKRQNEKSNKNDAFLME